ncbi:hypothetical protein SAMN04488548_1343003 [Gordonia westfalica]|uniref:Uncharacterized protein n=1 Tax=Gordonia westfalica TaxID=158898 RepID=A0A1H2K9V6_9ACTN|nr:hypothetical protein SAMN04488548_1343003 [Gordonia westfalica]
MPPENPVIHDTRLGVDRTADGHTAPQQPASAEPAGELGELLAQLLDRLLLVTGRGEHGMAVERTTTEIGDDQHRAPGTDVHPRDAQRVPVDGQRILGSSNGFRPSEIWALGDQAVRGERVDLAVDRRGGQARRRGELIPGNRPTDPDRMQDRGRRSGRQLQRRRDHSPTHGTNVAVRVCTPGVVGRCREGRDRS